MEAPATSREEASWGEGNDVAGMHVLEFIPGEGWRHPNCCLNSWVVSREVNLGTVWWSLIQNFPAATCITRLPQPLPVGLQWLNMGLPSGEGGCGHLTPHSRGLCCWGPCNRFCAVGIRPLGSSQNYCCLLSCCHLSGRDCCIRN